MAEDWDGGAGWFEDQAGNLAKSVTPSAVAEMVADAIGEADLDVEQIVQQITNVEENNTYIQQITQNQTFVEQITQLLTELTEITENNTYVTNIVNQINAVINGKKGIPDGIASVDGDGYLSDALMAPNMLKNAVTFLISGATGVPPTVGVQGDLVVPFAGTITGWALLGDVSGSMVVDIWKGTIADQIAGTIVDADSITASLPPTVSGARGAQSTALTGWTTGVAAGDVLRINVDSVTSLTRVTLVLFISRGQ